MFKIDFDRRKRLLSIRLAGFWTVVETTQFERTMREKLAGVRATLGHFDCFCDVLEYPVQTREIAERHEALQKDRDIAPRRLAVLTNHPLLRMQSSRISESSMHKNFETRDAAMAWLRSFDD